jgi:hypothetical protein
MSGGEQTTADLPNVPAIGSWSTGAGVEIEYASHDLLVEDEVVDEVLAALRASGVEATVERSGLDGVTLLRLRVDAAAVRSRLEARLRSRTGLNHLARAQPQVPYAQRNSALGRGPGIQVVGARPAFPGRYTELDVACAIRAAVQENAALVVVPHEIRSEEGEPLAFRCLAKGSQLGESVVLASAGPAGAATYPGRSTWTIGVGVGAGPPRTHPAGQDLWVDTRRVDPRFLERLGGRSGEAGGAAPVDPTLAPNAPIIVAHAVDAEPTPITDAVRRLRRVARSRSGYPLLDAPERFVPGRPFELRVGIAPNRDFGVVSTGETIALDEGSVLQVLLVYDPASFSVDAPSPITFDASEGSYPSTSITVTPLHVNERYVPNRRIAAHYLVDGVLRGIAVRTFVEEGADLLAANRPQRADLLDLAPLTEETPPDLVLFVYRVDAGAPNDYAWAAFPSDAAFPVPEVERTSLGAGGADLATLMRRAVAREDSAFATYLSLLGRGREIAGAMPDAVRRLVKRIAESPRRHAATVLLVTEELDVPWELAAPDGESALRSRFGGHSEFLGAHVAIGRWPLTRRRSPRDLRLEVDVRRSAVLTAHYAGNAKWKELPDAEREAEELRRKYHDVVTVPPLFGDVVACLQGDSDIVHFAMHGQFDPQDDDGGLVLIREVQDDGSVSVQFLKAHQVEALDMPRHPFVFLNVCQVGAGMHVLGDYGGMAAAFLEAGASAVVASIWNVDDAEARRVSLRFYEEAADDGRPAAEILRRMRSRYVVGSSASDESAPSPTLLGYQLFGHPRFRIIRA